MSEELLYWQALNRAMDAETGGRLVGVHAR
jgi:hypothetical protein